MVKKTGTFLIVFWQFDKVDFTPYAIITPELSFSVLRLENMLIFSDALPVDSKHFEKYNLFIAHFHG